MVTTTSYCLKWFMLCQLLSSCALFFCQSNEDNSQSDRQQLAKQIAKQASFDFGEIKIGSTLSPKIKLDNPTEKTLKVKSLSSSCGCMSVSMDSPEIAPGKSGFIEVKFNTERFIGKRNSSIHVLFAQPAELEIKISAKVDIRNLIVEPELVVLHETADGNAPPVVLTVKRHGSPYWKINSVQPESPAVSAEITSRNIQRSTISYEIGCKLGQMPSPDNPTAEFIETHLVFQTNDSAEPEFRVPVRICRRLPIRVSPKTLVFSSGESETKSIILSADSPIAIKCQITGKGYRLEKETDGKQKRRHRLRIIREKNADPDAELVITSAQQPATRVSVKLLRPTDD